MAALTARIIAQIGPKAVSKVKTAAVAPKKLVSVVAPTAPIATAKLGIKLVIDEKFLISIGAVNNKLEAICENFSHGDKLSLFKTLTALVTALIPIVIEVKPWIVDEIACC